MKQLSGLDASFLYMETATTFGHVSGLGIYERPSPDFNPLQVARDRFGALVGLAEPMRRKLVEVPLHAEQNHAGRAVADSSPCCSPANGQRRCATGY